MKANDVTIRIKIAGYELEVTGEKKWAEQQVAKFVERIKKQIIKESRKNE